MDFQQTIAELEKQAAKLTEAANVLRALQGSVTSTVTKRGAKVAPEGKVGRKRGPKKGSKRVVSAETRAKLAEAMTRRHAQKRAAAKQ
jgi:hypothetical protein